MPNRPTRPGKHVARHKAPSAFSRATTAASRLRPAAFALGLRRGGSSPLGVRRTGGTVVALGAVVLAGAAGNGSAVGGSMEDRDRTAAHPAVQLPSAAGATADAAGARRAEAGEVSRSQVRAPLAKAHTASPDDPRTGGHTAQAESVVPEDPRAIARQMMAEEYGWGAAEFGCLDDLWVSESDWQVRATNPTSGAYGIPQALPPQKMAKAGDDWRTNPATQIEWGLRYIDLSYGTPCSAWEFKQANNWY